MAQRFPCRDPARVVANRGAHGHRLLLAFGQLGVGRGLGFVLIAEAPIVGRLEAHLAVLVDLAEALAGRPARRPSSRPCRFCDPASQSPSLTADRSQLGQPRLLFFAQRLAGALSGIQPAVLFKLRGAVIDAGLQKLTLRGLLAVFVIALKAFDIDAAAHRLIDEILLIFAQ